MGFMMTASEEFIEKMKSVREGYLKFNEDGRRAMKLDETAFEKIKSGVDELNRMVSKEFDKVVSEILPEMNKRLNERLKKKFFFTADDERWCREQEIKGLDYFVNYDFCQYDFSLEIKGIKTNMGVFLYEKDSVYNSPLGLIFSENKRPERVMRFINDYRVMRFIWGCNEEHILEKRILPSFIDDLDEGDERIRIIDNLLKLLYG